VWRSLFACKLLTEFAVSTNFLATDFSAAATNGDFLREPLPLPATTPVSASKQTLTWFTILPPPDSKLSQEKGRIVGWFGLKQFLFYWSFATVKASNNQNLSNDSLKGL
jgi:hypothetical protein